MKNLTKMKIPAKYKHATSVLGVDMPEKGDWIEVPEDVCCRLKKLGFTVAKTTSTTRKKV